MHGYSDGHTCSGGTVRGLESGDLQLQNAPLSYQRPVADTLGACYGENLFPAPFSTLIWWLWVLIPWPAKAFFAQNSIAHMKAWYPSSCWLSYLTSFTYNLHVVPRTILLLSLLPLESLSKFFTLTWTHTDFPIFLFYPSTHKPCLGNFQLECASNNLYL